MKWIKYQILQSAVGEQVVLANKKIGYNDENLAIAQKEAYDGYEIVDDEQSFDKEPLGIEVGGTGAKDAATARQKLGITPENIGAAPANHIHASCTYSEAETATGETWIDGKPIYRKVYKAEIPEGSTYDFTDSTPDFDVIDSLDNVIHVYGSYKSKGSNIKFPIMGEYSGTLKASMQIWFNSLNAPKIQFSSDYDIDYVLLVVEYTKV